MFRLLSRSRPVGARVSRIHLLPLAANVRPRLLRPVLCAAPQVSLSTSSHLLKALEVSAPAVAVATPKPKVTIADFKFQNEQVANMCRFVSKNTLIPKKLNEVNPDDPKLKQLQKAYEAGDLNAGIFKDDKCDIYLLYLMNKNKIPFNHGMTLYVYLMGLRQFPGKANKLMGPKSEMVPEKLVVDNRLTPKAVWYLKTICSRFKFLDCNLQFEDLQKFILSLPPSEQTLLCVHKKAGVLQPAVDLPERSLLDDIPYIAFSGDLKEISYWVPSISIINFLLQKMCANPLKADPVFGNIGYDTLIKLHENEKHPIAICSPHVKSSIKSADLIFEGDFIVWLHDQGHLLWGNLFSLEERRLLWQKLIAPLQLLISTGEAGPNEVRFIRELSNYDLTTERYSDKADRLEKYVRDIYYKNRHLLAETSENVVKNFLNLVEPKLNL